MKEIKVEILSWRPPRFSDFTLTRPFDDFQRALASLGIDAVHYARINEEQGLEEAVQAAIGKASIVCVVMEEGDRWQDRLDPLRKMMAKVSRKRLTLTGKSGIGLLPGGTEVLIDPHGETPLFLLPFSLPDSSTPTLLIITPGGEAVLKRLPKEIEKSILKLFNSRTRGHWVRMCGVEEETIRKWRDQAALEAEVEVKFFPAPAGVDLLVRSRQETSLKTVIEAIQERWGTFCYSWEGEAMEEVVGRLLLQHKKWLAIAESCTGGRISARITRIPGSSRYFDAACVTYSYPSKERLVGVPKETLEAKGAVSAEVAAAMAEGIRQREGVDLGLSVTGIAGPDGGTVEKPVGLVYIALSDRQETIPERFLFQGDREEIQAQAAQMALEKVRRNLLRNERLKTQE